MAIVDTLDMILLKLDEISDKLDGGEGSGSGSGFLKVGADAETHTLDKTWQEIFDALAEGWYVTLTFTDEVSVSQTRIIEAIDDSQSSGYYFVNMISDESTVQFSTDSADGYPVPNQDDNTGSDVNH